MDLKDRSRSACSSCRERKTKCDKQRPSCSQCINAGWHCPGYPERWRFCNKSIKLTNKKCSKNSLNKDFPVSESSKEKLLLSRNDNSSLFLASKISTSLQDSLRARFAAQMCGSNKTALSFFAPSAPYLYYLPPRIGNNAVLDNAIECICFSHIFRSDEAVSRTKYLRALGSLQETLLSRKTSLATETLAAVMLLQMFEQFTDKDSFTWIKHAGGAIRLIESRGPQLLKGRLERAILDSQLGRINFECIREGRNSFLAEAVWQPIFERSKHSGSTTATQLSLIELEYHQIVSRLPGLLKQYLEWQRNISKTSGGSHIADCSSHGSAEEYVDFSQDTLYKCVLHFRDVLRAWRVKYATELFRVSNYTNMEEQSLLVITSGSSTIPARLVLGLECLSATFLIITNHMLVQLRHGRDLCFKNMEKATNIDFELDSELDGLENECMYHVGVVNKALSSLGASHPTAAFLLRDGLATAWQKATALHYEADHDCKDPILRGARPF